MCSSLHHQFEWNEGKGEIGNDGKGFANCATQKKTSKKNELIVKL